MKVKTRYTKKEREQGGGKRGPKVPEGEWPATVADAWGQPTKTLMKEWLKEQGWSDASLKGKNGKELRELVKEETRETGNKPEPDMLVVKFSVELPDRNVDLSAYFVMRFTDKLANLFDALRRESDPDEIDSGELAGRRCRIKVKHRDGFADVEQVLPADRASGGGRKAAESKAEDLDDFEPPF